MGTSWGFLVGWKQCGDFMGFLSGVEAVYTLETQYTLTKIDENLDREDVCAEWCTIPYNYTFMLYIFSLFFFNSGYISTSNFVLTIVVLSWVSRFGVGWGCSVLTDRQADRQLDGQTDG